MFAPRPSLTSDLPVKIVLGIIGVPFFRVLSCTSRLNAGSPPQGVGELKQAKKEWMTRLHDNEADFEDIFDSQAQLLNRFSLSNYVSTAMGVVVCIVAHR